jgi:hypothetical protein
MDLSLRGSERLVDFGDSFVGFGLSTSAMTTSALLAASNIVVAPPIPRESPVTMATCPSSRLLRKLGSINMLTSPGLPQSEREVIETHGRTIQVGMPAKQARFHLGAAAARKRRGQCRRDRSAALAR